MCDSAAVESSAVSIRNQGCKARALSTTQAVHEGLILSAQALRVQSNVEQQWANGDFDRVKLE